MTPDEQRIAIAEACGWKHREGGMWFGPDGGTVGQDLMPDYLNDLNACHEMEKTLTDEQWIIYQIHLDRLSGLDMQDRKLRRFIIHSPAARRCEAFLRTMGKWKEKA